MELILPLHFDWNHNLRPEIRIAFPSPLYVSTRAANPEKKKTKLKKEQFLRCESLCEWHQLRSPLACIGYWKSINLLQTRFSQTVVNATVHSFINGLKLHSHSPSPNEIARRTVPGNAKRKQPENVVTFYNRSTQYLSEQLLLLSGAIMLVKDVCQLCSIHANT